ncbi:hypothetical protein VSS74_29610 [Conexibacter stalactiti]|uniref:Lipoprotein with Yx(FWY)xxD motif n=1 Tax=Conexibacter stalactiti TaxID=1940611 RepID=A0ABU4HZ23_9ACTN|nr:hypothetical protein [Conexibacter stalactiti]MDW5598555.1 hypothetical protein [Conexibacter stalactiti]MEC5039197.1 hypothetical protein [Conexibacter stalactiti]
MRLARARASLAPAALVAVLAAAGCGGTSDSGSDATTAETVAEQAADSSGGGVTTPTVTSAMSGPKSSYGAAAGSAASGVAGAAAEEDDTSQGVEGVYGSGGTDADGPMEAPARPSTAAVVRTADGRLGTILVNGDGRTLYRFTADEGAVSSCAQTCAGKWPPLTTSGAPDAEGQARAALLGTSRRSDGLVGVTYDGHPVYRYGGDAAPGDIAGEGLSAFGGRWYAVDPSGALVEPGG